MTCAYLLSAEGKKVAVFEDGEIGSGESGRTTAHLVTALDDRYYEIEQRHGKDVALLSARSHAAAISKIEEIVTEHQIECDFKRVPGYLFLHPSDKPENLEKELQATQRAGLRTEITDHIPGINHDGKAIVFHDQGQFHIMKYLNGLAKLITSNGGQIFTHTHIDKVEEDRVLTASGRTIKAKYIISATNTPINNLLVLHTKQHAYRTYVIGGLIEKDSLKPALWWDTGDQESEWSTAPYHYVRIAEYNSEFDLLIVGGEDHKTGQADEEYLKEEDRYRLLENWAREKFPQWIRMVYSWSGQVMEPVDGIAYIGHNPNDSENIFVVTGDSGNGMTHGTIAGMLITDLIMGRNNPWKELYDPARINFRSTKEYLEENLNTFKQYVDLISPGDIDASDELAPNTGAIMRHGLTKLAVYKDPEGTVSTFSALCPHLGCVVKWNNDEKTFDCPCHGSRFSCLGKVINGPANSDLKRESL